MGDEVRIDAVAVPTDFGPVVRGQRWGEGEYWVVLVHEPGRDLDAWGDVPVLLAEAGFVALAVDLPGHGLSDDPWEPSRVADAIVAAAGYSRGSGARRCFLVAAGTSAGAGLSVAAGHQIDALVALSPWHDPDDVAIRRAGLPKLFLVGSADQGAATEAQRLFQRCKGWTVVSKLPVVDQGTALLGSAWGTHAREQILAFLRDYRR